MNETISEKNFLEQFFQNGFFMKAFFLNFKTKNA